MMITPIPGAVPTKPGSATRPFFGIQPEAYRHQARCQRPFRNRPRWLGRPACRSQALAFNGPHHISATMSASERHRLVRRSRLLLHRRRAAQRQDADGYFWLMGRVLWTSRHQCERPSPRHHGSRVLAARRPPQSRRSRRSGSARRSKRPSHRRLRHRLNHGNQPSDALKDEPPQMGHKRNRRPRSSRRYPLHRSATQNPQRQNHAPPSARSSHTRRNQRRRHHA